MLSVISCVSATDIIINEGVHTLIEVTLSKLKGHNGDWVNFSAKVKTDEFLIIHYTVHDGVLNVLKDGERIQSMELSEDPEPNFSLKLEKGHIYSLEYEGACFFSN